jgi:hypothetical protein
MADFLDAPFIDPPKFSRNFNYPYLSWLVHDHTTKTYEGWQKAILYVMEHIEKSGPYDGLLCFSQGGLIGIPLTKLLQLHSLNQSENDFMHEIIKLRPREKWFKTQPPFKFVILAGCFSPIYERGTSLIQYFSTMKFDIPSLHVMGQKDKVIEMQFSEQIAAKFSNPVIHVHDGAHYMPQDEKTISILRSFLEQFLLRAKL